MTRFFLAAVLAAASTLRAVPPNVIVILTDDLGYADLGVQQKAPDIRTPRLDQFAAEGVRCTAAYTTAPQCSPSRVGLLTGRYQQRYGIDEIPDMPLPLYAVTLAERLKSAGYVTGMTGKWHLEPAAKQTPLADVERYMPGNQGFDNYFSGTIHRFYVNMDKSGERVEPHWIVDDRFRVDVQTEAALTFLNRHGEKPFFLYVSYFAPHTPLQLPEPYVDQFSDIAVQRRRAALAMILAVDTGVGKIMDYLSEHGLDKNTLVFFTSDNGAPLKGLRDTPLKEDLSGWDGSLNTPLVGEKGMLSEGGIRVPFMVRWPGVLPAGEIYYKPVSLLDVASTSLAAAGLPIPEELDGVNLVPHLQGKNNKPPHVRLFWRFWTQAAVRQGQWKLLLQPDGSDMLFDMESPEGESKDLAAEKPRLAALLRRELVVWTQSLMPKGLPRKKTKIGESRFYQEFFPKRPALKHPAP